MEKVELERRLRERTAELEAANKGLEAFAATVSHDLRNPLGAIDAMTKLIVENFGERIPAEAVELLQSVNTEARQTLQLIDDLLRFARLGRQPLSKQPVDVTALVRDVLAELRLVHADRSVALRVGELPNCVGDPALLKQVLLNLLSNAYKFTGRKDVAIVEVEGRRDNNELVFLIRDNGAGFDMRYADRLFGVFQRLHGKSKFEGTGVGLSIVRSIVERHGGRVWAEGEVDKGATFYFSIPRTD
jgi:light-regulated signal transduction histidine kinase (bacteriophytochrome)